MGSRPDHPGDESFWEAIRRLARETRAPLKEILLRKVGIAAHDIRVTAHQGQLFDVGYDWLRSYEEDAAWSVNLTPRQLKIRNISSTEPVVTEVHLFAEFWRPDCPLCFRQWPGYQNVWRWSEDYLSRDGDEIRKLPVLDRGTVVTVKFPTSALVRPQPEWLDDVLPKLRQSKDELVNLFIAKVHVAAVEALSENPNLCSDIESDDPTRRERATELIRREFSGVEQQAKDHPLQMLECQARQMRHRLRACSIETESWLAVVLDDEIMLPFRWKDDERKFIPGFFHGGLQPT